MSDNSVKPPKYHYTYEITNIYNGMRYIGARSSKNPPNLDTKYMSSSKYVKRAIKNEGLDHFVKIVLQEFPTRKLALEQEIFLHNKFNVNKDPMFYNKAKQTSTGFDFQAYGPDNHNYGKPRTEESKQKMRIANMGKYVGEKSVQYGIPKSEEIKKKISETKVKRGSSTGINNSQAILKVEQVLELRYLYDIGTPLKILREEFDLKKSQVYNIGSRNSWKSVPEESSPPPIDPP